MSDSWYSKALGDGVDAHGPSAQIQEAFDPVYLAAGKPSNMAVFSRYDLRSNVVTVYFSPPAKTLASAFDATPCERPSSEKIGLLVGDHNAWYNYFPERMTGRE